MQIRTILFSATLLGLGLAAPIVLPPDWEDFDLRIGRPGPIDPDVRLPLPIISLDSQTNPPISPVKAQDGQPAAAQAGPDAETAADDGSARPAKRWEPFDDPDLPHYLHGSMEWREQCESRGYDYLHMMIRQDCPIYDRHDFVRELAEAKAKKAEADVLL